ncbi:hypothetical protein RJT34_27344 [Clitoria ternatea]|uniref:DELLA protein n=1 Tax=Clitoria ternatea TaxID=43366 RepID=A0AAN9F7M3_CLITE
MLGKQKKNLPLSLCDSSSSNKMVNFLKGMWKLRPRVMVVTEQESNVNGSSLAERVDKVLEFYGVLFKCLERSVPEAVVERIMMERGVLGEEIKNIVGCEGVERKERHEKLESWIPRLELAGFVRVPIGYEEMMLAGKELLAYGNEYMLHQENKCLFVKWNDKPLFSVSAWKV